MNDHVEWMNIFDQPQGVEVELKSRRPGAVNGTVSYSPAGKTVAAVIEKSSVDNNGSRQIGMTVLLPGVTPEIHPGDRLNLHGTDYEIATVVFCTGIDGLTVARRCKIK